MKVTVVSGVARYITRSRVRRILGLAHQTRSIAFLTGPFQSSEGFALSAWCLVLRKEELDARMSSAPN